MVNIISGIRDYTVLIQLSQHIIIIGSGLAGLTVAIALAKAGHTVEVLESAPKILYIGAGRVSNASSLHIADEEQVSK